ncbi:nitroreductase [Limobrevibacterium gyesilva]|uniref:Nitroreductase n=1 Tax=Limobrevibacterium gyesilva TaxID=2991712 RepID=A0AA41YIM0_9PROT|nr:nitroreductase [Limobrevibacterium gyesilva]MCW3474284.1 nitroreductase [Limobrevibacterium gyesilva]
MADVTAMNETEAAILSRRSVRGYLPRPVPQDTVEHLLDVAARAPSGTNMQPWRVIALAGDALARFCAGVSDAFLSGAETDAIERAYYPRPLHEPYLSRRRKIGWDLYGLLGIARGEKEKMRAHVVRNLQYFGAPVGLICTIDRRMEIGSWIDYGMFLENISIAARARGLDSCAMAVFAEFPGTVRALLDIPEDETIVCGMAIGYEDKTAPANALETERVRAAAFTRFLGFGGMEEKGR